MSLKVMCAGCSAEERERTESDVRRGLGARAAGSETWIVSVVNLQSRWSVTMDGPGIRALNFTAPPGRLTETIQEALQAKTTPPAPAAPPAPAERAAAHASASPATAGAAPPKAPAVPARTATVPPNPTTSPAKPAAAPKAASAPTHSPAAGLGGPRRTAHECDRCHERFAVTFDAIAGEPEHMAPVACPHCWHTNQVLVGETAADTTDYRAERD